MPIDIERFERADVESLREPPEAADDEIVGFLAYEPVRAYTVREIQAATGLSVIEVVARLGHLRERGLVRNRGSYWAVAEGVDPPEE